ncbi:MAG: GntR family transcriptional regulator [Gemmatimonadetes bacterium]|nr:GntR family transcriptional regulator [Gemmatimonadota bacterium]
MNGPEGLRIDRVSTADQVAAVLRDKMLLGELRPGTPLQELSLADSFGISRNTMREAIRLLVYEGLVRHNLHRGAAVTALTEDDVRDIYRVRQLLELAGVDTIRREPGAHVRRLRERVDEMEEASQARDWVKFVESDMRFHRQIVAALGSERIDAFFRKLVAELRLGLVLLDRTAHDARASELQVSQHREICDILERGRKEETLRALRVHLIDAERRLCAIVATE